MNFFATTAVIDRRKGFLMLYHLKSNSWRFPGGKLDTRAGESAIQCAHRELREETGLEVNKLRFLGSSLEEINGVGWFGYYFAVTINGAQPKNCEPEKHRELRWTSLGNVLVGNALDANIARLAQLSPTQERILDALAKHEWARMSDEQLAARVGVGYRTWTGAIFRISKLLGFNDRKRHRHDLATWWRQYRRDL